MADTSELRMNVAALKRVDPYVKDILETARHVALYTFNSEVNEWERTNVEGALFVYSRNGEPYHGIVIMNRLNTNNLVEPVTYGLEMQVQEPFLLYRNERGCIYGIWFYGKDECTRIASVLDNLVKELRKKQDRTSNMVKPRGVNVDIITMLSKAQGDYNIQKNSPGKDHGTQTSNDTKPGVAVQTSENGIDETPKSVMDFFAKASTTHFPVDCDISKGLKQPVVRPGVYLGHGPLPVAMMSRTVSCSAVQDKDSDAPLRPLLQRLMSNPVHTVEHIEKQQRSVTPETKNPDSHLQSTKDPQKLFSGMTGGNVSIPAPKANDVGLANSVGFLRISSPVTPASLFGFQHAETQSQTMSNSNGAERPLSAPLCGGESCSQPALMPPVMFTSSKGECELKSSNVHRNNVHSTSPTRSTPVKSVAQGGLTQSLSNSIGLPHAPMMQSDLDTLVPELAPLTKNQLLRAFTYLIKNDPDFVTKLHEAYVKSFNENS